MWYSIQMDPTSCAYWAYQVLSVENMKTQFFSWSNKYKIPRMWYVKPEQSLQTKLQNWYLNRILKLIVCLILSVLFVFICVFSWSIVVNTSVWVFVIHHVYLCENQPHHVKDIVCCKKRWGGEEGNWSVVDLVTVRPRATARGNSIIRFVKRIIKLNLETMSYSFIVAPEIQWSLAFNHIDCLFIPVESFKIVQIYLFYIFDCASVSLCWQNTLQESTFLWRRRKNNYEWPFAETLGKIDLKMQFFLQLNLSIDLFF